MSTDITGWVEIKINNHWFGVIHINVLIQRNYSMFDFLFGGRNEDYENAIAGSRMPEDLSSNAIDKGIWETWIGLDELLAINWDDHAHVHFTDDWKRLIEMMKLVSQGDRVTDVRLVCTFF